MRAGRSTGRADGADHLSYSDGVADPDVDFRHMAVAGRKSVAMVDFDHAAVTAAPPRRDDLSVRGRAHRIAGRGPEIKAGVHGGAPQKWIAADAEAGSEFNFADHRFAVGHQRQRPVQAVHMCARDVNAIKLALERSGI